MKVRKLLREQSCATVPFARNPKCWRRPTCRWNNHPVNLVSVFTGLYQVSQSKSLRVPETCLPSPSCKTCITAVWLGLRENVCFTSFSRIFLKIEGNSRKLLFGFAAITQKSSLCYRFCEYHFTISVFAEMIHIVAKTYISCDSESFRETCNNYLCTYDLYSPVHNVLDAFISITRASGRGLGPGIREFFWAPWNGIEPIGECHLGPKKLENTEGGGGAGA